MLTLEVYIMNPKATKLVALVIVLLAAPLAISFARAAAARPADSGAVADEAAIKQVVAGFSDGWNSHDAHSMCLSLAEDVLDGVMRNRPIIVTPRHARVPWRLYRLSPRLVIESGPWLLRRARRASRDGPSR